MEVNHTRLWFGNFYEREWTPWRMPIITHLYSSSRTGSGLVFIFSTFFFPLDSSVYVMVLSFTLYHVIFSINTFRGKFRTQPCDYKPHRQSRFEYLIIHLPLKLLFLWFSEVLMFWYSRIYETYTVCIFFHPLTHELFSASHHLIKLPSENLNLFTDRRSEDLRVRIYILFETHP